MSKARIIIEYKGKRYRVGKRTGCACKRDCDLFVGGVCNRVGDIEHFPCDEIHDAFIAACDDFLKFGFKEVKK